MQLMFRMQAFSPAFGTDKTAIDVVPSCPDVGKFPGRAHIAYADCRQYLQEAVTSVSG
jgi:hypothetical protein